MLSRRWAAAELGEPGLSARNSMTCRLLLTIAVIGCFIFHAPPVSLTIKALPFNQLATSCQTFPDLVKNGDRAPAIVADPKAPCATTHAGHSSAAPAGA
jgi:hypothetical protein